MTTALAKPMEVPLWMMVQADKGARVPASPSARSEPRRTNGKGNGHQLPQRILVTPPPSEPMAFAAER